MISRQWRGVCRTECAEAQVAHPHAETFPAIGRLPGFVSASILRRPTNDGVEFLIVTHWSSIDAIRGFAGADVAAAVVPPAVHAMMIEYDRVVRHYDVVP